MQRGSTVHRSGRTRLWPILCLCLSLFGPTLLAGCGGGKGLSTFDRWTGTIPRPQTVTDARDLVEEQEFPNLASVPNEPPPMTSKKERSGTLSALSSDRLAVMAPAESQVAPVGQGILKREHVATIYFGHGSTDLDSQDRSVLAGVVDLFRSRGGVLRLVGHTSGQTSSQGDIETVLGNFRTSMARSNKVAETLVDLGVARDRLLVEAFSDRQPVYAESSEAGVAGNRRVEIFQEFGAAVR